MIDEILGLISLFNPKFGDTIADIERFKREHAAEQLMRADVERNAQILVRAAEIANARRRQ
jgi:hypothetical protein